jgi:hypothetical protein
VLSLTPSLLNLGSDKQHSLSLWSSNGVLNYHKPLQLRKITSYRSDGWGSNWAKGVDSFLYRIF